MGINEHRDGSGQDTAETTDASKFGNDAVGASGAELDQHAPVDEPLGVEDPSIVAGGVIARDDVESREERHQPEDS